MRGCGKGNSRVVYNDNHNYWQLATLGNITSQGRWRSQELTRTVQSSLTRKQPGPTLPLTNLWCRPNKGSI